MILHLDTTTFVITDENEKVIPLMEARAFWTTGQVEDCNLGFKRLAQCEDWSIQQLKDYYNASAE